VKPIINRFMALAGGERRAIVVIPDGKRQATVHDKILVFAEDYEP